MDALYAGGGPDKHGCPFGVHAGAERRNTTMNPAAELAEPRLEQRLGRRLRQHQEVAEHRGQRVEGQAEQRLIPVPHHEVTQGDAARLHRADHIDSAEHFERVRVHHGSTRGVLRTVERVDQQMVDAGLLQTGGERQAGGAGADDQDLGLSGQHRRSP